MQPHSFVEFVGLPGLGKTTLANALTSHPRFRLHFARIDASNYARTFRGRFLASAHAFSFCARFPLVAARLRHTPLHLPYYRRRMLKLAVQLGREKGASPFAPIKIADQWLLQEVSWLLIENRSAPPALELLYLILDAYLKQPITLVVFDGSVQVAIKRIQARSNGSSFHDTVQPNTERHSTLTKHQHCLDTLVARARERQVRTIKLDSTLPIAKNVEFLAQTLINKAP